MPAPHRVRLYGLACAADRVIGFVTHLVDTQHVRGTGDARRHAGNDDELLADLRQVRGLNDLIELPDHVIRVPHLGDAVALARIGIGRRIRDSRRADVPDWVKVTR